MSAAIEAAARAIRDFDDLGGELAHQYATVAIIAFLRNCEVSEGAQEAYWKLCCDIHFPEPPPPNEAWDVLRLQLATELEGK